MLKKIYFVFLFLFGELFEHPLFYPLNQLVRCLYLHLIIPFLEFRINRQLKNALTLQVRNSAKSNTKFNIFYSDIDLTAYIESDSPSDCDHIRTSLAKAKKVFLSLGELEIYLWSEDQELKNISTSHWDYYSFLRDLRKVGWMQIAARESKTLYHKSKAERAIRSVFLKNSISQKTQVLQSFAPAIESRLQQYSMNINKDFTVSCPFLGLDVSTVATDIPLSITLSQKTALILLATVPYTDALLQEELALLRKQKDIQSVWRAVTEIEFYTIKSVYRARPEQFPWMDKWAQQLQTWLRTT